jgi:hypothetical protein
MSIESERSFEFLNKLAELMLYLSAEDQKSVIGEGDELGPMDRQTVSTTSSLQRLLLTLPHHYFSGSYSGG